MSPGFSLFFGRRNPKVTAAIFASLEPSSARRTPSHPGSLAQAGRPPHTLAFEHPIPRRSLIMVGIHRHVHVVAEVFTNCGCLMADHAAPSMFEQRARPNPPPTSVHSVWIACLPLPSRLRSTTAGPAAAQPPAVLLIYPPGCPIAMHHLAFP